VIFLALIGMAILFWLRLPVKQAGSTANVIAERPARPLSEIVAQPRFIVALICAVGSFCLMTFVMTGAPLAMVGCGFSPDEATLGISWHVMAMFGPSFFTGPLIARFGKERIVAFGMLLLVGCALVALSGIALWQFWTSLILLGVGWNFAFIGATTMVTQSHRPSERNKVQAFNDFLVFGSMAASSFSSGQMLSAYGWDAVNLIVFPFVLVAGALLIWLRTRKSTQSPI
jgi:MFS family permease